MIALRNIFFIVCLLFSAPAWGANQYFCSGQVQYRPCNQPIHQYKRSVKGLTRDGNGIKSSKEGVDSTNKSEASFARVLTKTFKIANKSEGLWRGTIEGNGLVHLKLQIIRNGAIESARYMGSVFLPNKSTWFSFKSSLPKGLDWSWDISALAG